MIQQTIEKLHVLRLNTMATALRDQAEQPAITNLSFEERLAMGPRVRRARRRISPLLA